VNNSLALSIRVPLSQENAWSAIVDWEGQSKWMLQTKVWVTSDVREGVGTSIAAFTGPLHRLYPKFSSLGLLDLMRVVQWQPPHHCDVIHYGKILKGGGSFQVEAIDETHSIFHWREDIQAPRIVFLLARPFILLGVKISLRRLIAQLQG
jgi:hypothetical protein